MIGRARPVPVAAVLKNDSTAIASAAYHNAWSCLWRRLH